MAEPTKNELKKLAKKEQKAAKKQAAKQGSKQASSFTTTAGEPGGPASMKKGLAPLPAAPKVLLFQGARDDPATLKLVL